MRYVLRSMLAMLPVLSMAALAMAHNEDQLVNTEWVLVAIVEGTTTSPAVEGTRTTLELREDGTAGGRSTCNDYGSSYEVEGHALSISYPASTPWGCHGAEDEQERRYFEALESASSFDISKGELTIVYGEGQGTLVFARGNQASVSVPE